MRKVIGKEKREDWGLSSTKVSEILKSLRCNTNGRIALNYILLGSEKRKLICKYYDWLDIKNANKVIEVSYNQGIEELLLGYLSFKTPSLYFIRWLENPLVFYWIKRQLIGSDC